jgi:hypothetical protein
MTQYLAEVEAIWQRFKRETLLDPFSNREQNQFRDWLYERRSEIEVVVWEAALLDNIIIPQLSVTLPPHAPVMPMFPLSIHLYEKEGIIRSWQTV